MLKSLFGAALALALLAAPVSAPGQTAIPAATKSKAVKKKPLTPGQIVAHERQKKCGAEWKQAKAAGKVEKTMTWPKYWSACNKRLKGAS
jgi:hypothetical protein